MKITKNNKKLIDSIDVSKTYEPIEAIKILKENKYAKFDETLEVAINLGIDSNKTDQGIRGVTSLPKGTGKSVNVAVLTKGDKQNEAKDAEGEPVKKMDFLSEEEYLSIMESLPAENQFFEDSDERKFIAKMGADCLIDLLSRIDLEELSYELRHKAHNETSKQRKTEALKRLQVVESFREKGML